MGLFLILIFVYNLLVCEQILLFLSITRCIWIFWAFNRHLGSQTCNFWGRETLEISALQVRVRLQMMHFAPGYTGHLWKKLKIRVKSPRFTLLITQPSLRHFIQVSPVRLATSCIAIILIPLLVVLQCAAHCTLHRNAVLPFLGCQRGYLITKINNV